MNRVVHFEFHSPDAAASREFFTQVFGWELAPFPDNPDYYLTDDGQPTKGSIGGAITGSRDGRPRTVTTIEVASLDAALAAVRLAGGTIVVEPMVIRSVGRAAFARDPAGILFGIMQIGSNAGEH
jgi:uncharacterized protein